MIRSVVIIYEELTIGIRSDPRDPVERVRVSVKVHNDDIEEQAIQKAAERYFVSVHVLPEQRVFVLFEFKKRCGSSNDVCVCALMFV